MDPVRALTLTVVAAVVAVLLAPAGAGVAPGAPATTPVVPALSVGGPGAPPVPSAPTSPTVIAPGFQPAAGAVDLGPLPASTPLEVEVALPLSDPAGLTGLLDAQYAPGTSLHGEFEPPSSLAERFGPSAATVASVTSYFRSYGLATVVSPDHLLLTVEGPGGDVAAAFGTSFDRYREPSGSVVFGHPTPATLPSSLSVSGVLGLGDTDPVRPAAVGAPLAPIAGPAAGCGGSPTLYVPCDILGAYNMTPLVAAGTNGSGERIAVVDPYSSDEPQPTLASDLASFASRNGASFGPTEYVYPVPTSLNLNASGTNPDWDLEDALDLEWSHASAPGAAVDMTLAPDAGPGLYASVDWVVAHQAANVISMSWGEPDVGVYNAFSMPCSAACNASTDGSYGILGPVLEFAAAEGIGVFAATGDCGAAGGTSGVSTDFPASDPYVTAVGGTVLTAASNGSYESEVAWSGNSTGASSPGCQNQGGSGGGWSPFPRPWWQSGLPTTPSTRGTPDIALDAGTPVETIIGGGLYSVIGTSVATPIWAGIAAIADQYAGAPLGFLDPSLYGAASRHYAADFHDITSGSNGYSAGPGWDPVTGLGTPNVGRLVTDLARTPLSTASRPTVELFGSPRYGPAPLTVRFSLNASGGSGRYTLEGVDFGDGNATTESGNGTIAHTYVAPGVYPASGYVVDTSGNDSVSAPIAVVVGGGSVLNVTLNVSDPTPGVGVPVTFTVTVRGGTAPYLFDLAYGDGSYLDNATDAATVHAFGAVGGYCAAAVVGDAATPPDGGQSPRVGVGVGGAAAPSCPNDDTPLTVVANASAGPRDAPADFPSAFVYSGGASEGGVGPSLAYTSSNDPYVTACDCLVLRHPGRYAVVGWVNDSEGQEATAATNLTVLAPIDATFTASSLTGPAPFSVDVAATASGGDGANASATVWTSGAGSNATGATARFTYSVAGEYLLVGHLEDSGHGNASEAFLIDVTPATGAAPSGVDGTITPAVDVSSGATVTFNGTPVGANASDPNVSLRWSLPDGSVGYGPSVNTTVFGPLPFADGNRLNLSVDVAEYGTDALASIPISLPTFYAIEGAGFVDRATAVALSASLSPPLGVAPLNVAATSSASAPGGATVVWSWGDATTSGSPDADHTYVYPGGFDARPTLTDPYGDRAALTFGVLVNATVQVVGGAFPLTGPVPLTVAYRASAVEGAGPPYAYRWTLANGTMSNATSFSVTYTVSGTYTVRLTVIDRSGAATNRSWTVVAYGPGGPPLAAGHAGPFPPWVLLAIAGGLGAAGAAAGFLAGRSRGKVSPSPRPSAPGGRPGG